MIHAICDFCGKDCDRTATLLSMHLSKILQGIIPTISHMVQVQ